MSVVVKLKHQASGEEVEVVFDDNYLKSIIETDPDRVYDALGDKVCKCQPVGETNVIECGCIDYIDDFEILEHTVKAV